MQIGRNTGHNPKVRLGLISNGVDVNGSLMGVVSSTHGDDELERTVDALANTIYSLRADGDLPARPK